MRPARADAAAGDRAARARNANMGIPEFYAELARSMTEERIDRRAASANACEQRVAELAIAGAQEDAAREQARVIGAVKSAVELGGVISGAVSSGAKLRADLKAERALGVHAELAATLRAAAAERVPMPIGGLDAVKMLAEKVGEPRAKDLAERWPEQLRGTAREHRKLEKLLEARVSSAQEALEQLAEDRRAFAKLRHG